MNKSKRQNKRERKEKSKLAKMAEINKDLKVVADTEVAKKIMGELTGESDGIRVLRGIVKSIGLTECTFCKGPGHNAR